MTTLLLTHPSTLNHLTPPGHPERPDRIRAVDEILSESRFDPLVRELAPEGSLDLVTLFKALGGGWEQTLPDPPKPMVVQVKETVTNPAPGADPAPK